MDQRFCLHGIWTSSMAIQIRPECPWDEGMALRFGLRDLRYFCLHRSNCWCSTAAGNDVPEDKVMRGLHIYMGGVGIQQLFILGFCVAVFVFWRDFRRQEAKSTPPHVLGLVYTLVAVLILVTVSSNKDDVRGSCLMCLDSNHFPSDRVCQRIREQYSGA